MIHLSVLANLITLSPNAASSRNVLVLKVCTYYSVTNYLMTISLFFLVLYSRAFIHSV